MKKQTSFWLIIIAVAILILSIYIIYKSPTDNEQIIFVGQGHEWKAKMVMTIKGNEASEFMEIKYIGSNPDDIGEVFFIYQMPGNSVSGRRHLDRVTKSITSHTSSQGGFIPNNSGDNINLRIEWNKKEEIFELQRK